MNLLLNKLHTVGRNSKLTIILLNDLILGLLCWLVFGPPMATFIASEFSTGILEIFYSEWLSFFKYRPLLQLLLLLQFFSDVADVADVAGVKD